MAIPVTTSQSNRNQIIQSHPKIPDHISRERLAINEKAINLLRKANTCDLCSSRFFTYQPGGQKLDEHFQKLFEESFAFMRGKEVLVREGAYKIFILWMIPLFIILTILDISLLVIMDIPLLVSHTTRGVMEMYIILSPLGITPFTQ